MLGNWRGESERHKETLWEADEFQDSLGRQSYVQPPDGWYVGAVLHLLMAGETWSGLKITATLLSSNCRDVLQSICEWRVSHVMILRSLRTLHDCVCSLYPIIKYSSCGTYHLIENILPHPTYTFPWIPGGYYLNLSKVPLECVALNTRNVLIVVYIWIQPSAVALCHGVNRFGK